MKVTGFKLDSQKKFYLKVVNLVRKTERDKDVIDLELTGVPSQSSGLYCFTAAEN